MCLSDRKKRNIKKLGLCLVGLALQSVAACGPHKLWQELPVKIQVMTQTDLEVIQTYNDYFGVELFRPENKGVEVEFDDLPPGTLGLTTIMYNYQGIHDARVDIAHKLRDKTKYRYTYAHELGHVLGLDRHLDQGLMKTGSPSHGKLTDHFDQEFTDWVRDSYGLW